MEQKIALMIMALALSAPPETNKGIWIEEPALHQVVARSLDERFNECMQAGKCTAGEQIHLLQQMNENMRKTISRMKQGCAMKAPNHCTIQHDEISRWHKLHLQMEKMMESLEITAAGDTEPSATIAE